MLVASLLFALQVAVPTVNRLGIQVWATDLAAAQRYTVDVSEVVGANPIIASKQPLECAASAEPLWFDCTLAIPTLSVGPHTLRFRTWETLYGRELPSLWSLPLVVDVFVREAPRNARIVVGVPL